MPPGVSGARRCPWGPSPALLLLFLALLSLGLHAAPPGLDKEEPLEERVCYNVEVKGHVANHLDYRNCTAVLGYLRIIDVRVGEPGALSFPLLREVTDYVLLFKVWGVPSLHEVFPALAVVRGRRLFSDFALVVYEVEDLVELGLQSLGWLGSSVRLTKNLRLCYLDTVKWDALLQAGKVNPHGNRPPGECPDVCPRSCRHCWSSTQCQRQLDCQNCSGAGCLDGKCCHPECLGGCLGPGTHQCLACQHVRHQGKCLTACPSHLYMLEETRCVTETECSARRLKLVRGEGGGPGLCVRSCPPGYMLENQSDSECKRCPGDCPKECRGKIVDNLGEAKSLKGCTKILGNLEIQIKNGHMVGVKMEERLGSIEEITGYLKVVRSDALLSLHFFANLRVIRGQELSYGLSFSVHSNKNMEALFRDSVTKNLTIEAGEVFILNNRKLCIPVIRELLTAVGKTESEENLRTNGDRAACSVKKLDLKAFRVESTYAILNWTKFQMPDPRRFISYEVFYREIDSPDTKIDIFEGRDACEEVVWMTKEVESSEVHFTTVRELLPWTWYAAFVQTIMMAAPQTAISSVVTFRTKPSEPTPPTLLELRADSPDQLTASWGPPQLPNGNVTHYVIFWTPVIHNDTLLPDACESTPLRGRQRRSVRVPPEVETTPVAYNETCCACPQQKDTVPNIRYSSEEIHFNDMLQDLLFTKIKKGPGRHEQDKYLSVTNSTPPLPPSGTSFSTTSPVVLNVTSPPTTPRHVILNVTTATTTSELNVTANVTQPPNMAVVFHKQYAITGLDHFTTYKVEVMACQDSLNERCSLTNASASARTLPSKSADAINSSSVVVQTRGNRTDQVFISWRPPPRPNGAVLSYQIQHSRVLLKDEERRYGPVCQSQRDFLETGGYLLTPLEPGKYRVRIRAITQAGNGSYTNPVEFVVPSPPGSEPMGAGAKAGIAVVVLAVMAVVGVLIWWYAQRSLYKQALLYRTSPNPCYISSSDLYIPDGWEVPREKIKLLTELGKGSFGRVYEGIASGIVPDEPSCRVAVKTVNDSAGFRARVAALKEATIMKGFRTPHVVKLLGVVSRGEPAFIIMELMALGDLKNYLRNRRPDRLMEGGEGPPTLMAVLQMAAEIADGMAYLADTKFVHCDLAARNCMVAEDRTVKIGDFGLARDIYEGDYYRKGGRDKLPIRWMAPESLADGVFTSQSDIWSYGVVLWEMVTLAEQPYQGLSNEEVLQFVRSGRRMPKPEGCPDELFEMMESCWVYRPEYRPTFQDVLQGLAPYLTERFRQNSYFYSEEYQALTRQAAQRGALEDELSLERHDDLFSSEPFPPLQGGPGLEEESSHSGEGDDCRKPLCPGYPPSLGDVTSEEGEREGEADEEEEDDEELQSDGCDDCRTPFLKRVPGDVTVEGGVPPAPSSSPCSKRGGGGQKEQGGDGIKGYIKPYDAIIMKELPNGHCTSSPPLSPTLTVV